MSKPSVSISKFVGTFSLGLLTGVSYTLSTITLPALLAFPTATSARRAFLDLRARARRHLRLLTGLAATSLTLAYTLSPTRARHPYLLWTAIAGSLGGGLDYLLRLQQAGKNARGRELRELVDDGDEGEDGDLEAGEVNGEEVRSAVESFRFIEGVRAGVSGLAFAMGVVGIWGDRY